MNLLLCSHGPGKWWQQEAWLRQVTETKPGASSASSSRSPVPGRRSNAQVWLPLAGHALRASETLTTLTAIPCPSTSVLVAQHSLGIAQSEFCYWVD